MVSLQVWHWYSIDQALAAVHFSRLCRDLEQSPSPPSPDEAKRGLQYAEKDQQHHRSFAIACVFSSVAFLEAGINEVFASAAHPNLQVGGHLPNDERQALESMRPYLSTLSTLHRFQAALLLLRRNAFDPGAAPFQDVALVVRLRNALVHYEPRWRSAGPDVAASLDESALIKALAQKRFSLNPFTGQGNPFFPDKCLGHGLTSWAWKSSLSFSEEFFKRLGVAPPFTHLRASLTT